jgi:hypothetical protein
LLVNRTGKVLFGQRRNTGCGVWSQDMLYGASSQEMLDDVRARFSCRGRRAGLRADVLAGLDGQLFLAVEDAVAGPR